MADFPERPATFNARWWSMLPESPNIDDERGKTRGRAFGPAPAGLESQFPAQRFADAGADDPKDWGAQPAGGEDPTAWGAQPVDTEPRQAAPSGGFTDRLGRGLHAVTGAMESFSRAVHGNADDERLGSMVSRAIPDISELFSGAVHDTLKAPGQIVGASSTTSFDDIRPTIKQKLMDTGFDEATAQRKTDELIQRYAHQEGMTNLIMGPLTALVSPIFGAFRSTVTKPIEETTGFPKEATEMGVMTALGFLGLRGIKHQVEALGRNPDNKLTRVHIEPDGRVSAEVVGDLPAEPEFKIAADALGSSAAERNIRTAWEERGIHPAEVVEDAQRDAFVRSEIAPPSFDGWHGSAEHFEAFDLTMALTGEGTNSRGHGVYIAQVQDTAVHYRDLTSDVRSDPVRSLMAQSVQGRTRGQAIARLEELVEGFRPGGQVNPDARYTPQVYLQAIERLRRGETAGMLYRTRIYADQNLMVDLDRPLSEQPAVMERLIRDPALAPHVDPTITGESFRLALKDELALSDETISNRLDDVGVPGFKYLDEFSRNMDVQMGEANYRLAEAVGKLQRARNLRAPTEGLERRVAESQSQLDKLKQGPTQNFVIFDTKRIEITHKNGVELARGDRFTATNSPVMLGTPLTDLARTGESHVDAVLNDPVVNRVIDNAVINRDYDVRGGAGRSTPAQDPILYMDRHFPRTMEVDGARFDPAEPFIIREAVAQHVTDALVNGGMDRALAERIAGTEYAAKAEAQWYASHAIDQAAAEAAYRPILDRIENRHEPPNLYAKRELTAEEPKPTKAELNQAKDILQPDRAKPLPDLREELWDLINIKAPLELIENHPMVKLALEEARALPRTASAEDMRKPAFRANRVYDFNGEKVVGTDAAVQRLKEQARAFAGGEVAAERRAILLIGPPAAGKSSIADVVAKHRRAAIIDPDEAKQVIPEYRGGIGAGAVHEESSVMAKEMIAQWTQDGSNIILPKVGADVNSIRGLTEALQGMRYTVDLIHVEATPEISRRRNIIRMLQDGRLIDPVDVANVGDKPRGTFYMLKNEGLYDETADISTVARFPKVISGEGPIASILSGRDGGAQYTSPPGGDQAGSRPSAAGADLTRPENLTSPRLRQQPAPPAGSYVNPARAAIDQLMGLGHSVRYMLDPMATGSKAAMVIAKDAISVVRRIHWEHARLDNEITRRFTPEQWERMYNAHDEESVLVKSGEKGMGAAEHMGHETLTREERMFVEYIADDTQEAWLHALDTGMVEGEGLPAYTPRMVLNVTADLGDASPRALNELGRNVFTRTSQMKHRRHLLAEETEAAAKEMVAKRMAERGASAEDIAAAVEKVKIARNIRALPLAAARLKEAAVWRDMINKIEDHGKAAGQPTVWSGEAPAEGWFTIEGNPAFSKWVPVTEKVQDIAGAPYWQPVRNSAGEVVMKREAIYLSEEFKGPMESILDGGWRSTMTMMGKEWPTPYGAVMAVKSRAMLALLNSPLIHNAVVWSKVMEAAGGREWLGFGLYGRGNRIVNGPPQRARELIERGLAPMGPRGTFQNISDMMERPNIAEDHHVSWTGKLAATVPHLFDAVVNREPRPLTREQATDKMRTLITAGKSTPEIIAELGLPPERVDTFKQAHDLVQSIAKETDPNVPHPLWDRIFQEWQRKYPGAKAQAGDITDFVSSMTRDRREGLIAKLGPEERAEYDARQARTPDLPEREEGMLHLAFSDAEEMGGASLSSGDAVERGIAKVGNFYHNTLLWDRVRDVQFGLADFLSDRLVGKGVDRLTADRTAAHFSNIIVGSIPKEAMSSAARGWANVLMFSRSFTLGNLSTYKQAAVGLPKPVLAQIERDFGLRAPEGASPELLESLQAQVRQDTKWIARKKALATLALSYALYQIGNALFQHALNIFANDSTGEEELRGYARRFAEVMNEVKNDPFELRHVISHMSPTADNEPHKGDRILIGYDKDGTAIFGRNPTGKFGEELVGYPTMPAEMIRRKMSPLFGGLLDILTNDKGFGHKVYDENDSTLSGDAKTAWLVAKHLVMKHLPEQQMTGALDLLRGEGDPTVNKYRAFGPVFGFTTSMGVPGGPARGEAMGEKQQFDARFNLHWPDISKQIKRGDVEGAREAMTTLGVTPRMQEGLIRNALDPSGALRGSTLRNFYLRATPQQIERFERARERQPGPRQPGATP